MKKFLFLVLLLTAGRPITEIIETRDKDTTGRWLVQRIQIDGKGADKQAKCEKAFTNVAKWTEWEVRDDGTKIKIKKKDSVKRGSVGAGEGPAPLYYVEGFVSGSTGTSGEYSEDCVAVVEVRTQDDVSNVVAQIADTPGIAIRVHQHKQWLPQHSNLPCNINDISGTEWKEWLP